MSRKIFTFSKRGTESRLRAESKRAQREAVKAEEQAIFDELIKEQIELDRQRREAEQNKQPKSRRKREVAQPPPPPRLTEDEIEARLFAAALLLLRARKERDNPALGAIHPSPDEITAFRLSMNGRQRRILARMAAGLEMEIANEDGVIAAVKDDNIVIRPKD
jgi:hypothetical protein